MLKPINQLIFEDHDLSHNTSFDPLKIVLIKLRQKLNSFIRLANIFHYYTINDDLFALLSTIKVYQDDIYEDTRLSIRSISYGTYYSCDFCTNVTTKKHHKQYNYRCVISVNETVKQIIFDTNQGCFSYLMFTMHLAPFLSNYTLFLCYAHDDDTFPIDIYYYIGFIYLQRCYRLCKM